MKGGCIAWSTSTRSCRRWHPPSPSSGLELYDVEVERHRARRASCGSSSTARAASTSRRRRRHRGRLTAARRAAARRARIPGPYALEVSSPGLERPLRTPAHFARRGRRDDLGEDPRRRRPRRAASAGVVDAADDAGFELALDDGSAERIALRRRRPGSHGLRVGQRTEARRSDEEAAAPRASPRESRYGDELRDDGGAREHRAREGHLDRDHARGARERARSPRTSACPTRPRKRWSRSTWRPATIKVIAQELDEDGNVTREWDDTPDRLRAHRRADRQAGDLPAHPRGGARDEVRGVRRPRGRHRHRHHPADRRPLHAARPRQGRGAAARRPSRCRTSTTTTAAASRPTSSRSARPPRARRSSCRARTRAS